MLSFLELAAHEAVLTDLAAEPILVCMSTVVWPPSAGTSCCRAAKGLSTVRVVRYETLAAYIMAHGTCTFSAETGGLHNFNHRG